MVRQGDPFFIHCVANQKILKADPLLKDFFEKRLTMVEKLKGGPFNLGRYYMLHGKK